jgi:hypothetical protein
MWVFIAVAVVAVLMWAVMSLMELGREFGVAAMAGLIIAGNSGFFIGFAVFTLVFLALFVVMGSVVGRFGLAADFALSVAVAWIAAASLGLLFGLVGFTATFLAIGAFLNRAEKAPPPERGTAGRA